MKALIQNTLHAIGYEGRKYPGGELKRRVNIIKHFGIDKVLDVGANSGQFAMEIRKMGYKGRIVSFEPLPETYQVLERNAANDAMWETKQLALGSENKKDSINVAGNTVSSSILDIMPEHTNAAPESKYTHKVEIEIRTLDDMASELLSEKDRTYFKIDTQGFEYEVLKGAENHLGSFKCVQLEMSFIPMYKDEMLFHDMMKYMSDRDFEIYTLEPGLDDPQTGRLLQIDGIFVNRKFL